MSEAPKPIDIDDFQLGKACVLGDTDCESCQG